MALPAYSEDCFTAQKLREQMSQYPDAVISEVNGKLLVDVSEAFKEVTHIPMTGEPVLVINVSSPSKINQLIYFFGADGCDVADAQISPDTIRQMMQVIKAKNL